jgi:hypothetical protein
MINNSLKDQIENLKYQIDKNNREYLIDLNKLKDRYKSEMEISIKSKNNVIANLEDK